MRCRACSARRAWISSTITVRVVASMRAAGLRAEQDVQRLRRRDQDVRRRAAHARRARPAACRRCAPQVRISTSGRPCARQLVADAGERRFEVALDVVRQRLQRRDVDDLRLVRQAARRGPARTSASIAARKAASVLPEPVGAAISVCRPGLDRRPGLRLRRGRRGEAALEPGGDGGVKQSRWAHVQVRRGERANPGGAASMKPLRLDGHGAAARRKSGMMRTRDRRRGDQVLAARSAGDAPCRSSHRRRASWTDGAALAALAVVRATCPWRDRWYRLCASGELRCRYAKPVSGDDRRSGHSPAEPG